MECASGDGIGGSERRVGKNGVALKLTKEECVQYVKDNYPDANGATFLKNCDLPDGKCGCYAEMDMNGWNSNDEYESCSWGLIGKFEILLQEIIQGV